MLLATETYSRKLMTSLTLPTKSTISSISQKDSDNNTVATDVLALEDVDERHLHGGNNVYTSGTTNRPVGNLHLTPTKYS